MAVARPSDAEYRGGKEEWQDTQTQFAAYAAGKVRSYFSRATDATQRNAPQTADRILRDSMDKGAQKHPNMDSNCVKSKKQKGIMVFWKDSFAVTLEWQANVKAKPVKTC